MGKKKGIGKVLLKGAVAVGAVSAALYTVVDYKKKKEEDLQQSDEKDLCKDFDVFMKGKQIKLGEDAFKKVKIKTVMGGVDLDLRETVITEDVHIKCKSVMSGVNIRVPEGVNVVVQGKTIMGGITNFVPFDDSEDVPVIYVEARQVMGGLCIRAGIPDENTCDDMDCAESEKSCEDDMNCIDSEKDDIEDTTEETI